MSHALKINLTQLVYVRKEKKRELKIFISSLFHEIWNVNLKCKFGFFCSLLQKNKIFWFQEKKIFWDRNTETAKISANYEFLTGEEVLHSGQRRVLEQAKSTFSRLENVLEKQIKTIEDQGEKQKTALENRVEKIVSDTNIIKDEKFTS